MARVSSLLLLFIIAPAAALDLAVQGQLNELIKRRLAQNNKLATSVRETTAKVDQLEKRLLPVIFTFNRVEPFIKQRTQELEVVQEYINDPKNLLNPYDEAPWVEGARKETAYVCCDVRRNPRLAQEIQENLARGLPALSEATGDTVADRARAAAQGRPVAETIAPAPQPQTVPPKPSPVPPERSRPRGLSTGIISGLPLPSPPPTPAQPAPVPPTGTAPAPPPGAPATPPPVGTTPAAGPVGAPPPPPPAATPPAPAPAPNP